MRARRSGPARRVTTASTEPVPQPVSRSVSGSVAGVCRAGFTFASGVPTMWWTWAGTGSARWEAVFVPLVGAIVGPGCVEFDYDKALVKEPCSSWRGMRGRRSARQHIR